MCPSLSDPHFRVSPVQLHASLNGSASCGCEVWASAVLGRDLRAIDVYRGMLRVSFGDCMDTGRVGTHGRSLLPLVVKVVVSFPRRRANLGAARTRLVGFSWGSPLAPFLDVGCSPLLLSPGIFSAFRTRPRFGPQRYPRRARFDSRGISYADVRWVQFLFVLYRGSCSPISPFLRLRGFRGWDPGRCRRGRGGRPGKPHPVLDGRRRTKGNRSGRGERGVGQRRKGNRKDTIGPSEPEQKRGGSGRTRVEPAWTWRTSLPSQEAG
eukprot:scaffold1318_cov362-Pavlova_lutheri.AAC.28